MAPQPIIECIPNFSEGRNQTIIDAIADEIRSTPNCTLLHVDISYDANRTVMTFAGHPSAVIEAAAKAIFKAAELIDMRKHKGKHPRLGSTCVCPLVPVSGIEMEEVIKLSYQLAERIGDAGVPVYLYENSSDRDYRKNQADIRRGEYEGLPSKLNSTVEDWKPDYGPQEFQAKIGATVLGARFFMLAYNVNLKTKDLSIAKSIAKAIRQKQPKRNPSIHALETVKAIGWYMEEFNCVQISMNIMDYRKTGFAKVYETIRKLANEVDIEMGGSELIGLVPEQAMLDAGMYYLPTESSKKVLIEKAVLALGFNAVEDFDCKSRIIEDLI